VGAEDVPEDLPDDVVDEVAALSADAGFAAELVLLAELALVALLAVFSGEGPAVAAGLLSPSLFFSAPSVEGLAASAEGFGDE
jgi:hypothetical protein